MNPLKLSRFAERLVAARPELQEELDQAAHVQWTAASMRSFLTSQESAGEPASLSALRRLRQRVILRVLARDLGGIADLTEVCAAMSDLAEVSIAAALEGLQPALEAELGTPFAGGARQQLLVVGMGKLGGGELNVSSDVDLVFVYPEEGETRGRRSVSNHEFFDRLGRKLIKALDETTDEGRVFRVDMRLRPWGDAGPLATSFDALEHYLVTQGREWERYAWIKARALSGDRADTLSAIVRPFVFRKYLDYGAFAAMRELHAQIRAEVARREMSDHIKLGPGGIREIEFIAQAFQLIRGGRDPSLQLRPTLGVLALLAQKGLLPQETAAELTEAYVFLQAPRAPTAVHRGRPDAQAARKRRRPRARRRGHGISLVAIVRRGARGAPRARIAAFRRRVLDPRVAATRPRSSVAGRGPKRGRNPAGRAGLSRRGEQRRAPGGGSCGQPLQ